MTIEDVESAAKGVGVTSQGGATVAPVAVPPDRADEELPQVSFAPEEAEVEEVSFYQKAVIRRVVASKHVIPHFYVTKAVRADTLVAHHETAKQATGATLTHYLMRACARALETHTEDGRMSYQWPASHLTADDMFKLHTIRMETNKPINQLLHEAVELMYELFRNGE